VLPSRYTRQRTKTMNEVMFLVEEAPEGGFTARALGASIFTAADDLAGLHAQVRDAVQCHYDDAERPRVGDGTIIAREEP
jgi:hypothetical protein